MELSGSMVALVTPMDETGALDLDALGRLVEWHVAQGTNGLVIAGTTGESASLTEPEYAQLLSTALEASAGRLPIIAGAGTASTAASLKLAQRAAGLGAQALLVVTPYYYRPTQEGLYQHYLSIADQVPLPLVLYNVPGRTAVDLLPETVARLAEHPRVIAIKEAVPDANRIRELRSKAEQVNILSGDDGSARRSLELGATGVISVVANVAPAAIAQLCRHCRAGDESAARVLDESLQPLYEALFVEPNPIPVKWALQQMGMIGGSIRLPLTPLSAAAQAQVAKALDLVVHQND